MSVIKLKNVIKKYNKDKEEICALNNVTLDFNRGKFYAIMGNSGSGKSTFLQCIGLLDSNYDGKIYINNQDVSNLNDDELSEIRADEIGFIFQSYYLNPNMNAIENVMLPLYLKKDISYIEKLEKARGLLKKLGLEDRENHYPKELSGGEQQRVAIARALINDPEIILADEPTGNLDSRNEEKIFNILKELSKENKCIIVVSHNEIIKDYADKMFTMKNGVVDEK